MGTKHKINWTRIAEFASIIAVVIGAVALYPIFASPDEVVVEERKDDAPETIEDFASEFVDVVKYDRRGNLDRYILSEQQAKIVVDGLSMSEEERTKAEQALEEMRGNYAEITLAEFREDIIDVREFRLNGGRINWDEVQFERIEFERDLEKYHGDLNEIYFYWLRIHLSVGTHQLVMHFDEVVKIENQWKVASNFFLRVKN